MLALQPELATELRRLACEPFDAAAFNYFLQRNGKDVITLPDSQGWTALHHAAAEFNLPLCNALLNENVDVTAANVDGNTALHYLCGRCRGSEQALAEQLEQLIDRILKPLKDVSRQRLLESINESGFTPLYRAIQSPNRTMALKLLRLKVNPYTAFLYDGGIATPEIAGNASIVDIVQEVFSACRSAVPTLHKLLYDELNQEQRKRLSGAFAAAVEQPLAECTHQLLLEEFRTLTKYSSLALLQLTLHRCAKLKEPRGRYYVNLKSKNDERIQLGHSGREAVRWRLQATYPPAKTFFCNVVKGEIAANSHEEILVAPVRATAARCDQLLIFSAWPSSATEETAEKRCTFVYVIDDPAANNNLPSASEAPSDRRSIREFFATLTSSVRLSSSGSHSTRGSSDSKS